MVVVSFLYTIAETKVSERSDIKEFPYPFSHYWLFQTFKNRVFKICIRSQSMMDSFYNVSKTVILNLNDRKKKKIFSAIVS